jgi:hypothetical protein
MHACARCRKRQIGALCASSDAARIGNVKQQLQIAEIESHWRGETELPELPKWLAGDVKEPSVLLKAD